MNTSKEPSSPPADAEPARREGDEPRHGGAPIALWLILLAVVLLLWGGFYILRYSGGWRSDVLDEDPHARRPLRQFTPPPLDPTQRGGQLYTIYCMACHGGDGRGEPGRYPPLQGSELVSGDPRLLAAVLLDGLEGGRDGDGEPYREQMPGFRRSLHHADIAALMTWLRTSFNDDPPAADPAAVMQLGRTTRARDDPWRHDDLPALQSLLDHIEASTATDAHYHRLGLEP